MSHGMASLKTTGMRLPRSILKELIRAALLENRMVKLRVKAFHRVRNTVFPSVLVATKVAVGSRQACPSLLLSAVSSTINLLSIHLGRMALPAGRQFNGIIPMM